MNKDLFAFAAILPDNGIKSSADKGVNLTLHTQELNADQWQRIFALKGKYVVGVLASQDTPVESLEVPDVTPEYKGEKSPSQRLKAVLYRIWEQNGKAGEFEPYYRAKMDALIEKVKEQLD
jgi:hypothetical protein